MSNTKAILPNSVETKVSTYDRTSAWLVAAIVVLGSLAAILAVTLMQPAAVDFVICPPDPVDPVDQNGGVNQIVWIEAGADRPDAAESATDEATLDSVTDAVSSVMATIAARSNGANGVFGDNDGVGTDSRQPGPVGTPGDDLQRWKTLYDLRDIDSYSRMLRSLGIELGVVSKRTNTIWRISEPGDVNRVLETSRSEQNEAIYFTTDSRRIRKWDQRLVRQAGVELDEVILVHFFPAELVATMQRAEIAAIPEGKTIESIAETEFETVEVNGVIEIRVKSVTLK